MSKVIRKGLDDASLPPELKQELESITCFECAETLELTRKPKLALPPETTPDVVVSLDATLHKIGNKRNDILVMIDHDGMLIRLKLLHSCTAQIAFNAFCSHWIPTFDAPTYVFVHRGSNIAAELMKELHNVNGQVCPIPTEAPWGIGLNERSHWYLHKSFQRLLLHCDYDRGHEHEVLQAKVEVGWNYAQHSINILPHYNRLGIMPRIFGSLDESPRLTERIARRCARPHAATGDRYASSL